LYLLPGNCLPGKRIPLLSLALPGNGIRAVSRHFGPWLFAAQKAMQMRQPGKPAGV
jgi:hypothetical protein